MVPRNSTNYHTVAEIADFIHTCIFFVFFFFFCICLNMSMGGPVTSMVAPKTPPPSTLLSDPNRACVFTRLRGTWLTLLGLQSRFGDNWGQITCNLEFELCVPKTGLEFSKKRVNRSFHGYVRDVGRTVWPLRDQDHDRSSGAVSHLIWSTSSVRAPRSERQQLCLDMLRLTINFLLSGKLWVIHVEDHAAHCQMARGIIIINYYLVFLIIGMYVVRNTRPINPWQLLNL